MAFAQEHGAKALAIENLKGRKPTGNGKKQGQWFYRFQHRIQVKYLTYKCEEFGLKLLEVFARGTSYFAYDGSAELRLLSDLRMEHL